MATHSILIVDDAAETRLFLKNLVVSLGYISFEAKNGPDAFKILKENKIDLVLLDILLPNMDGYQILEMLNKLKQSRKFKVVFITGIRGELDYSKLEALKPDEIIHKTIDIHVLKNKIRKIISGEPKTDLENSIEESFYKTGDLEFNATITNMPMELEVRVAKTSEINLTFMSPVKFKRDTPINFLSAEGSRILKIQGEIKSAVKNCVPFGEKFSVEVEILK